MFMFALSVVSSIVLLFQIVWLFYDKQLLKGDEGGDDDVDDDDEEEEFEDDENLLEDLEKIDE